LTALARSAEKPQGDFDRRSEIYLLRRDVLDRWSVLPAEKFAAIPQKSVSFPDIGGYGEYSKTMLLILGQWRCATRCRCRTRRFPPRPTSRASCGWRAGLRFTQRWEGPPSTQLIPSAAPRTSQVPHMGRRQAVPCGHQPRELCERAGGAAATFAPVQSACGRREFRFDKRRPRQATSQATAGREPAPDWPQSADFRDFTQNSKRPAPSGGVAQLVRATDS
jgi:hypothetical protein